MRLTWVSDPHLNFVAPTVRAAFYEGLRQLTCDALLLGGDIGEAATVEKFLDEFGVQTGLPVYFVLGNHDYYGGSIREVRERMAARQAGGHPSQFWLPGCGAVELAPGIRLVGHDGWGDGQLGHGDRSTVELNDFHLIRELRAARRRGQLFDMLRTLGEESAAHLRAALAEAAPAGAARVLVLLHVPPFAEACWHRGQLSDANWLPHFTCKAAGLVILEAALANPSVHYQVFCGHTHSPGRARLAANLEVDTAGAVYGDPDVAGVIEF